MHRAIRIAALGLVLAGCMDKAKADYDKCVERDQNYDVKGAVAACSAAVAADPKSPSGQAAAKKLLDLQSVADKLKTEQDDKAAREARIEKAEPPPPPPPTVTASQGAATQIVIPDLPADAGSADVLAEAQALIGAGDLEGAHKLLAARVIGKNKKPSPAEAKLLAKVCKQQKDRRCLTSIAGLARQFR